jgi:hypothetical protein
MEEFRALVVDTVVLHLLQDETLPPEQIQQLERRAIACIDPGQDRLALYSLPPVDAQDRIVWGQGEPTQDWAYKIV